ncbi:MAG TPA: ATP-binding cassette domain-containing protein, partial [Candidatus Bathyarchaeia archaeon]|nr:ATP-binding cassette domain-containing protein [Candidatus Bathyarchaeia archaeon]
MSIIQVDDVWKRFRIPHQKRSTILEHVASLLAFEDKSYEEFWALKNIHFSLARGESLGIIGPNGSGKSTLLKLMARVMKPNKGTIKITGSIAPILELGVGFHGDLSVKENAEVYGIILGISRSQMKRLVDPIIQFASLEKFRDTRLKHLSSGMQIRLAFSIAIQTAADIFLVDEALAVGDMEFQQKCLKKFKELKMDQKSIVLVSHDLNLIEN